MNRWLTAVLALALLAATGCDPRTAATPGGAVTYTAAFDDVRNLNLGHGVKISDVPVGTVTGLELTGDYQGLVTFTVDRDIPAGAAALIRQTSLLGENFIELHIPPTSSWEGPFLPDGAHIDETRTVAEFEEVAVRATEFLEAISAQDAVDLVDTALVAFSGREEQFNAMIGQLTDVTAAYEGQSAQIEELLDSAGRLGGDLVAGQDDFGALLDELADATAAFNRQRGQMLRTAEDVTLLSRTLRVELLEPHAATIEQTLRDLLPVGRVLVAELDTLDRLLAALVHFATELPTVTVNEQLQVFGWFSELSLFGQRGTSPFDDLQGGTP